MPSFSPFRRKVRRSLLIEINPFQVLAAGLRQNNGGPTLIDCAAEFAVEDDAGLGAWLDEKFGAQRAWVPAIGSIAPAEAVLRRENLQLRKLAEAGYLGGLLKELRRIPQPEAWTLAALDPLAGTPLAPGGTAHPGLLLGLANNDIRSFQQRLLDHRLLPHRIELGILPLLGAISGLTDWRQERRATVVVVIEQEHTTAYIIGKEGLHTPAAVPHGFASIVQAVRKEFGLGDAGEVRERLHQADDELLLRATKFVRAIGRDLKPLVDSYEMTTGQPVGEIYCAYLPPALQWIAEPLAQTMQRPALQLDCPAWLPTVGLQPADDLPPLGPHWLGALGLVSTPAGPEEPPAGAAAGPVPWRVDCRLPAQLPNSRLAGRRFAAFALCGALAAFALTLTLWQWYVIRSLDADTGFWNGKIASNQKLFNELIRATSSLRSQSARFDDAYALMQKPPPATDFILDLGRSLPPNMQVDRIESTGGRMAMRGSLREPPDQSSRTLGRYLEELRRTPAIGPLFSSIALTALQRANDSDDSLAFEITFTLAEPGGARP